MTTIKRYSEALQEGRDRNETQSAKKLGPFDRRPKGRQVYYKFFMYAKFRANRVYKDDFFL
ncbi:hypothetical protein LEP1GSC188_2537 [Leptospira weilii serovar Topaz str. LT2116]|uniref:Uncharacterized protein n=1 Tax=Leptospira weilii serovar Topaz str. LT2116 TaxID=1088540 RepID=M3FIH5_9LEPT|nr:hypothetical protein LEP1GSC188_2537 [Leptospira weilii serovar Topaz str. LT2116]